MQFKKAQKSKSRLRLALIGVSGSGKTYSALGIATALAEGGKIAVIDTERGSASLYADEFNFDVLELEEFGPDDYIAAIRAAETAKNENGSRRFSVIVIDSLSHAWFGRGGALEMVDNEQRKQKTQNSYTAWRNVTPKHNALVDAMLQSPCHVIVTMRAKTEYVQEKDDRGKTTIRKVGLAPVQRDGLEYEFTMVGDIDLDHVLTVTKTRCKLFADKSVKDPGADMGRALLGWLNSGVDAEPTPRPVVKEQAPTQERAPVKAAPEQRHQDEAPAKAPEPTSWPARIRGATSRNELTEIYQDAKRMLNAEQLAMVVQACQERAEQLLIAAASETAA